MRKVWIDLQEMKRTMQRQLARKMPQQMILMKKTRNIYVIMKRVNYGTVRVPNGDQTPPKVIKNM